MFFFFSLPLALLDGYGVQFVISTEFASKYTLTERHTEAVVATAAAAALTCIDTQSQIKAKWYNQ